MGGCCRALSLAQEPALELGRRGRFEAHRAATSRMPERHRSCVKQLSVRSPRRRIEDALAGLHAGDELEVLVIWSSIELVADDRVPEVLEVNPQLMGPPGVRPAAHERTRRSVAQRGQGRLRCLWLDSVPPRAST